MVRLYFLTGLLLLVVFARPTSCGGLVGGVVPAGEGGVTVAPADLLQRAQALLGQPVPAETQEFLQQVQDLLGEELSAAILEQLINQFLGGEAPAISPELLQQIQDLLSDQITADVLLQLINQFLGDTPTVSPDQFQQVQDLLREQLSAFILEQLISQFLGGEAPAISPELLQQIQDLLGEQISAEVLQQFISQFLGGLAPTVSPDQLQQVQDLLREQLSAFILEQLINQFLGGEAPAISPELLQQIQDLLGEQISAEVLQQLISQFLGGLAPTVSPDQLQQVQDLLREQLSAFILEQIINQFPAISPELLQQVQNLLGEQISAEVLQQLISQFLTLAPTISPDQLQQVQDFLLEQLSAFIREGLNQLLGGEAPTLSPEQIQQIQELLGGQVPALEQLINQFLGGGAPTVSPEQLQILQDMLQQLVQQLSGGENATISPDLSSGLLQQLQDLFSNATNSSAPGLSGPWGNSTLLEDVLLLLESLGLTDPLNPGEPDWEEIAREVGAEMQRYVAANVFQNVSDLCLNNTLQFLADTAAGQVYASQMWLSNGNLVKLEGFTTYNFVSYGSVEQCQAVKRWNPEAPFETQHCNLNYNFQGAFASAGLCVPANCTTADLKEMFEVIPAIGDNADFSCIYDYPWDAGSIATLCILCLFGLMVTMGTVYHVIAHKRIEANMTKTEATIEERKRERGAFFIGSRSFSKEKDTELANGHNGSVRSLGKTHEDDHHNGGVLNVGFVGLEDGSKGLAEKVAVSHVYCNCAERAGRKKLKKLGMFDNIMMAFSSIKNGSKILNTEPTAGNFGALNGIRVISMWWIILGHTVQFLTNFLDDPRHMLEDVVPSFWFSAITYSTVSVDTFFFLSGLLLTFLTLKQLNKANGKINWFLFYIHRIVRITPTYMIAIAIWTSLAFHFGQGPNKIYTFEIVSANCKEYWWTNLLYINNLYPFPGDLAAQCMGWSWYLANDMQFFIISPIIIYLLYKHSKVGIGLIVLLCLGSFGVTAYLTSYYGLPAGFPLGFNPPYNNRTIVDYGNPTADVVYGKPYCRIPTYLIGIVTGYIFYRLNGKPFKMNKWVNLTMWIAATGVGLAVVYGMYREDVTTIPQYVTVLYTVLSRPAFTVAVAWVAFSCTVGYGGPVNTLLSWSFWTPLSRITFSAYLLHPILMFVIYTTKKTLYHFTYMQYASIFVSNVVFAYAAAFLLSVGVEGPVMGLEKALLGGGTRGKKK